MRARLLLLRTSQLVKLLLCGLQRAERVAGADQRLGLPQAGFGEEKLFLEESANLGELCVRVQQERVPASAAVVGAGRSAGTRTSSANANRTLRMWMIRCVDSWGSVSHGACASAASARRAGRLPQIRVGAQAMAAVRGAPSGEPS